MKTRIKYKRERERARERERERERDGHYILAFLKLYELCALYSSLNANIF